MLDNKLFFLVLLCSCISSCISDTIYNVHAEFLCVNDSKPYSDSIFEASVNNNPDIPHVNPRYFEMVYSIKNATNKTIYLPLRGWLDSDTAVESSIEAVFGIPNDTIAPIVSIKKNPYNSNFINPGDSTLIFVKIHSFEKWGRNGIDVGADMDTILRYVKLRYIKSSKDEKEGFEIPNIIFDSM